ncbi:MAG: carboxypeptidase-like regulatory domain-containing protein [Bacteroidaceae bacterium]|nr:carboxypeptidase-like regulatory domain-containing protein [Bacteroidaceae bacterium]
MKTEDIDKRIGMPDVDAEWARFEQEVIGKETKASKRSLYSWIGSFAIAASVVIVAGLFFLNHDSKETEQILTEISEHPISHDVVSEPSSSEKPTELIAKTSPTKQVKIRRQELLAKNQDIKPESLKDLDKSLQGQIAGFNDLPPQVINLGSGYVMRNLGYKYRIPDGEPLLLINGELFPDSVKQTLNNTEIGHLDKFFVKFFKQRHQELENIKVLKEEEARHPYMEKFGDLAQYGVINITTSPDTLCDYYMNQHEELKASRYRISGIVLDEDNKPLPHTMIAVVKEGNKIWGSETADSTGHFAFWAPRTGVKIRFSYVGFYKVVELKPTDKPLTIRMRLTKDAKKVIKNISFE